jgi:tRNA (mo5U34)-methyltransferase
MTLQSPGTRVRGGDEIDRRIRRLAPWFHNLHLPDGRETAPDHPLGDFPRFKWRQLAPALPDDLAGWRALDVGCNAGFYSFELARRGADVLAIDTDARYLRQARWAAKQLDLDNRIRFDQLPVYELARRDDRFDLVLFMGVLYHLRHPLLALDTLAEKTKHVLVLQTLTMPGEQVVRAPGDLGIDERDRMLQPGWPKIAFVERRLAGDPTNWWAPNHAAVVAMLRTAGLEVLERPGHEIYVCAPKRTPPRLRLLVSRELDAASGR